MKNDTGLLDKNGTPIFDQDIVVTQFPGGSKADPRLYQSLIRVRDGKSYMVTKRRNSDSEVEIPFDEVKAKMVTVVGWYDPETDTIIKD